MSRRPYELKTAIKREQGDDRKVFWTTIGKAWPNKAGGFKIELAPGIAIMGGADVELMIWPPYDGDQGGGGRRDANYPPARGSGPDDDIPF